MTTTPITWRIARAISLIALGAFLVAIPLRAQSKPAIKLEQCANGGPTCDTANPSRWITGNLGTNNSDYGEGSTVPYRAILGNLSAGQTYKVEIEWDTTKSGKHAIDYLTTYDRSVSAADPCAGAGCGGTNDTRLIPLDSNVSGAGVTQLGGQSFAVFGGAFVANGATVANSGDLCVGATCSIPSNPSAYVRTGSYTGDSTAGLSVWFTANHSTAVLAWGGHVAAQSDWGVGNAAGSIPGSPYHMRIKDLKCSDANNCSSGSMDVSMSSAVVAQATTTTTSSTTSTSTTSTSTSSTSSTSTTVEETTTTVEQTTTTTAAPTTTAAATTTVTPTTTVAATTTAAPATTVAATTTVPADLQVINPEGEVVEAVGDSFTVLIPEELPATGSTSENVLMIAGVLVLTGWFLATVAATRRPRPTRQEEIQ